MILSRSTLKDGPGHAGKKGNNPRTKQQWGSPREELMNMEDGSARKYYDERCGLWYDVYWDDRIKCFVWTIAPYQKLIADSIPK